MTALCIDAGTSTVKTVAFDGLGRAVALERQPVAVRRRGPLVAEQDMGEVWATAAKTLRDAARAAPGAIDLIAVTGQGDGVWLVDPAGRPLGPAALWSDGRASEVIDRWWREGVLHDAFRITGSLAFPGSAAALLHWMGAHEPDRVARAHKALSCGGWMFLNLTGSFAADVSDAPLPLLDIDAGCYSKRLLRLFDLEWAEGLLPAVCANGQCVGALSRAAARATGLTAGLPVVMAPFDIVSSAFGAGAARRGSACAILGTTLCVASVAGTIERDAEPAGFTLGTGRPARYVRAFSTLAGTDVLDWAADLIGVGGAAALAELAGESEPGAAGLIFLPYLSPAGERAPFLEPRARGVCLGMTLAHRRADMARAVFEGLTYVLNDCLLASREDVSDIRLCGGAAASPFWRQLIADVTGVATVRTVDSEVGAKGALIAGTVTTGGFAAVDEAADALVEVRDRCEPRERERSIYADRFDAFVDVRAQCTSSWQRMA